MGRWVRVAAARQVPPGTGRTVLALGRRVALFNDGGEFHALDDTCPHQGASLGEGLLVAGRVICPWHSWIFDVRTGACPRVPDIAVSSYATRRAGDDVEVEVPEDRDEGQAS